LCIFLHRHVAALIDRPYVWPTDKGVATMRMGDEVVIRGVIGEINEGMIVAIDVLKVNAGGSAGHRIIVSKDEIEVDVKHFKAGELVSVDGRGAFPVLAEYDGWVWIGNIPGQKSPWTVRSKDCALISEVLPPHDRDVEIDV
jgi:hypothetical protein